MASDGLKSIRKIFLDTVFPPKCLVCRCLFQPASAGTEIDSAAESVTGVRDLLRQSYRMLTALCCRDCVQALKAISEPLCPCCGILFKQPHIDNHLCGDCILQPKLFRMARAAMVYDQQSMAIIHRFKYAGKTQLARPFGGLMHYAYSRYWRHDAIDLIIPVPLHNQKFRCRGFNQSYLMVASWKAMATAKPPLTHNQSLRTDVLIRNRATAPQTGLGRRQRSKNIKGAFSVRRPEAVKGKTVLLVDDVYTTGATVDECARMLLHAGAALVDVLTLARAI
jgi:ComF family protein